MTATAKKTNVELTGVIGSQGFCVAPAYVFRKRIEVKKIPITEKQINKELKRLDAAVKLTSEDITAARMQAKETHGEKYASIFDAHLLMLEDQQFLPLIKKAVKSEKFNVESLVRDRVDQIQDMFLAIEDPYLRERAIDIKDVGGRILRHLMGLEGPAREISAEPYVLVAQEVTPGEMLDFAKGKLKGICLDTGGATSHVAILAGALGIPSVFGMGNMSLGIRTGDTILIDTRKDCRVILHPDDDTINRVKVSVKSPDLTIQRSDVTADGQKISLAANVAHPKELDFLSSIEVKRIGLFRSEFIFMSGFDLPTPEYQQQIYSQVIDAAPDMAVLRTIDIGSDKPLKYLPVTPEENPAMGFRSIRLGLARPDILCPQLHAMLRAASHKNCRIIFPMVSTPAELDQIAALYKKAVAEVNPDFVPEWGIMLEVPSAVFMMDDIAKHTKYISLGTNDLLQFFYAIDRTNEKLAGLATHRCLPFLRLINQCIESAFSHDIKVGVCGEMASDPAGFIALLGFGITEFSMRPSAIDEIKALIPLLELKKVQQLMKKFISQGENKDLKQEIIKEFPQLDDLI